MDKEPVLTKVKGKMVPVMPVIERGGPLAFSLPMLDHSLPFHCPSLTCQNYFSTAFPRPSTAFSLPFLDLSLPFLDLSLPFLDLSLTFHCLSSTVQAGPAPPSSPLTSYPVSVPCLPLPGRGSEQQGQAAGLPLPAPACPCCSRPAPAFLCMSLLFTTYPFTGLSLHVPAVHPCRSGERIALLKFGEELPHERYKYAAR